MIAKHEKSGVVNRVFWLSQTRLEGGNRHKRFIGRARRIGAAQGSIQERLIGRVIQSIPGQGINPIDKQRGIEIRH